MAPDLPGELVGAQEEVLVEGVEVVAGWVAANPGPGPAGIASAPVVGLDYRIRWEHPAII